MYGFSDQSNAIPFTRFRALRHGSSRYSTPIGLRQYTERTFAPRPAPPGPHLYFARSRFGRSSRYLRPAERGVTLFLELLALAVLIVLNGFFVAAEYGLVSVRRTRMLELDQQGNRRAHQVLRITESPPRFITAMQLGVTLTSLGIGAFGELVPKAVALKFAERVALAVSAPVRAFFVIFKPFIWLLRRATAAVLHVFGMEEPGAEGSVHSEAELRILLSESTQRGEIEQGEQEMLYKVFDFADKEVSDVMVPRPEVVALSVDLPPEEALQAVLDSPYTRYPVYRGSLDDILGILHVRDLIASMHD